MKIWGLGKVQRCGKQFCELTGSTVEWRQAGELGGKNCLIVFSMSSILKGPGEVFGGGIVIIWAPFKKYTSYFRPLKITDPV